MTPSPHAEAERSRTTLSIFHREDMRAEAAEAIRYCRLGDRFMARYHTSQVLNLANKLKDARYRRAAMCALNRLRGAR